MWCLLHLDSIFGFYFFWRAFELFFGRRLGYGDTKDLSLLLVGAATGLVLGFSSLWVLGTDSLGMSFDLEEANTTYTPK